MPYGRTPTDTRPGATRRPGIHDKETDMTDSDRRKPAPFGPLALALRLRGAGARALVLLAALAATSLAAGLALLLT